MSPTSYFPSQPRPLESGGMSSLRGFAVLALLTGTIYAAAPLSLHPSNPHYFLFRGKPTVIVTSGEHYGAVLNLDFNYQKYLATLAKDGLNNTRTWAGAYCEPPAAFNIASNTLAPLPGRFISPWARSDQPGYANGGNKFDLTQWDKSYFARLQDFMTVASKARVIVELNLFCPFYEESMWKLSPMNAENNINGIGKVARTNVYTLDKHGGLLSIQEEMVRKIVRELKGFDNLYYEICNEPYFGGVTLDWQGRIAEVIAETERKLGVRHLISQNIANDKAAITNPHPAVSIFNFHYATPPAAVAMNYHLDKPIGDNETGFRGTNDSVYRMEGWDFIVAGGALYNNLDYSFVAGHEDGTFVYPASQPGGGSPELRRQLGYLKRVIHRFNFLHMRPDNRQVKAELPAGATVRTLTKLGEQYLIYVRTGLGRKKDGPELKTSFNNGELTLEVSLTPGPYRAEWLDPKDCVTIHEERFTHSTGTRKLVAPAFQEDLAVTIRRGY